MIAGARKKTQCRIPELLIRSKFALGPGNSTQPNNRVHKANAGAKTMTPRELEQLWDLHLAGEFSTKDVEATLATMTDDDVVDHIPVHSGGPARML